MTSTGDLISSLARRRGAAKLMVAGTYRPVDLALSDHPLKSVKHDLLVHQAWVHLGDGLRRRHGYLRANTGTGVCR
jgi:hypothetical protein